LTETQNTLIHRSGELVVIFQPATARSVLVATA
jgi:hypothetical protein